MEALLVLSQDSDVIEAIGEIATEQSCTLVVGEPRQFPALPASCRVRGALVDRDAFPSDDSFGRELGIMRARYQNAFFLSVSSSLSAVQEIYALDSGCHSCLAKPLHSELFLAHLRVLGRSFAQPESPNYESRRLRRMGGLELDIERATAQCAGEILPLTHAEFTLLEVLTRQPGKLVRHDTLGDALWGWESDNYLGHLKCHISRLRSKLSAARCPARIISVRGTGYSVSDSQS